jgi:hypothetical protein
MKRIRLLILLSVLAVALPVGLLAGVARAGGSTGSTSSLSIDQHAQYDALGGIIHVGLKARCPASPLPGTILVNVKQYPPETVVYAEGESFVKEIVCDGQTHTVGATVFGANFDEGRALATATFTFGGTGSAQRWINIIVMPS